nr:hypothetical protein BCU57_15725 [Shewanella sp. 10N.286.48.B5]
MTMTHHLLLAQFNNQFLIALDDIAKAYLGMNTRTAKNKAKAGALPFPVFKIRESAKCPFVVHVDDLALYIEEQCAKAKADLVGN